ncbi:MAG: hypothetical protein ACD_63C00262G0001 [uncultured bacterium]|nr:MAG: hypothetical protein ACD_63C00262G0001 [uncultured bacterium]
MDIFKLAEKRPPAVRDFLFSEKPSTLMTAIENEFRLNEKEMDFLVAYSGDILLGVEPVEALSDKLALNLGRVSGDVPVIERLIRDNFIEPFNDELNQTSEDVDRFKNRLKLFEKTDSSAPVSVAGKKAQEEPFQISSKSSNHVVRTTNDITPPKKTGHVSGEKIVGPRIVKPPSISQPQASKSGRSNAEKQMKEPSWSQKKNFSLSTVDDLKNVMPEALVSAPQDYAGLLKRMKNEIQNIANMSKAGRVEIIEAWRESNLYKTYIEIGNESMQQDKNIAEIAAFRKVSSKPYLTETQFHVMADISKLLLR